MTATASEASQGVFLSDRERKSTSKDEDERRHRSCSTSFGRTDNAQRTRSWASKDVHESESLYGMTGGHRRKTKHAEDAGATRRGSSKGDHERRGHDDGLRKEACAMMCGDGF